MNKVPQFLARPFWAQFQQGKYLLSKAKIKESEK